MSSSTLNGKVAIVTGARRGIGQAIALALSTAGADIAVCDIVDQDGLLAATASQITDMGRRCLAMKTDISNKESTHDMAARTLSQFGRIDILVNCAGIWVPCQTLLECSEENWDRVIDTNLKGTYFCCQAVGRIMCTARSGCILNLSSQVGITAGTGVGAYSISKAGIIMLTKQLALELAPFNIRVNSIAPGVVKTEFNGQYWKDPEAEKKSAAGIPLHRLAVADDIARSALFLVSEAAGYITGEVLAVNGGWHL